MALVSNGGGRNRHQEEESKSQNARHRNNPNLRFYVLMGGTVTRTW
jgi:hypothetical protein